MPEMDAREPDVGTGEGRARNRRQLVRDMRRIRDARFKSPSGETHTRRIRDARFKNPSSEVHKPALEIASEHDLLRVKNYCFGSKKATHLNRGEV